MGLYFSLLYKCKKKRENQKADVQNSVESVYLIKKKFLCPVNQKTFSRYDLIGWKSILDEEKEDKWDLKQVKRKGFGTALYFKKIYTYVEILEGTEKIWKQGKGTKETNPVEDFVKNTADTLLINILTTIRSRHSREEF